jgi:hypothetical protein
VDHFGCLGVGADFVCGVLRSGAAIGSEERINKQQEQNAGIPCGNDKIGVWARDSTGCQFDLGRGMIVGD